MSLFDELKRRNVFRVGLAYLLAAWVLLQIVDFVLQVIAAPDWILQVFVLAAAVGFPVVLIFSWVFEMTPEGVKRESEIDRSQSITPTTGHKLDRVIIGFLATAVVLLLADRYTDRWPSAESVVIPAEATSSRTPIRDGTSSSQPELQIQTASDSVSHGQTSVAVLPFINMSDDAGNEYFSDGISEELLNVLVRIEGLRVPSRTSSFTFKGSKKNIAEIGKELQVDHVLEGSVRKSGDRIRVTAQLIDVKTDTHLWSDSYTREVDDIFAVQDEIAQAIVAALKITLSGADQKSLTSRSTDNVAAYNKYLLGRYQWNQRTAGSLLAATGPLKEAVDLDPQFDQAWAGLADAYALIPEYKAGSIEEFVPLGRQAAEHALAINPDSARALTAQAYIKAMYEYDIDGANADFERAIQIDPAYATAHQWYGEILAVQRRTDEALGQMRLAAVADPLAPVIPHVTGWVLWGAGRLEESLGQYQIARSMDSRMPNIIGNMARVQTLLGNYDEARKLTVESGRLLDVDVTQNLAVIDALEDPGLKAGALVLLGQNNKQDGVFDLSYDYAALGEYDLALESLENAFARGDPYAIHMNRLFIYDPLRDDPRFQAMLRKMNLLP